MANHADTERLRCQECGQKLPDRPPGRPRLEVPVQNVLNALSAGLLVSAVARMFGISRATVYRMRDRGG